MTGSVKVTRPDIIHESVDHRIARSLAEAVEIVTDLQQVLPQSGIFYSYELDSGGHVSHLSDSGSDEVEPFFMMDTSSLPSLHSRVPSEDSGAGEARSSSPDTVDSPPNSSMNLSMPTDSDHLSVLGAFATLGSSPSSFASLGSSPGVQASLRAGVLAQQHRRSRSGQYGALHRSSESPLVTSSEPENKEAKQARLIAEFEKTKASWIKRQRGAVKPAIFELYHGILNLREELKGLARSIDEKDRVVRELHQAYLKVKSQEKPNLGELGYRRERYEKAVLDFKSEVQHFDRFMQEIKDKEFFIHKLKEQYENADEIVQKKMSLFWLFPEYCLKNPFFLSKDINREKVAKTIFENFFKSSPTRIALVAFFVSQCCLPESLVPINQVWDLLASAKVGDSLHMFDPERVNREAFHEIVHLAIRWKCLPDEFSYHLLSGAKIDYDYAVSLERFFEELEKTKDDRFANKLNKFYFIFAQHAQKNHIPIREELEKRSYLEYKSEFNRRLMPIISGFFYKGGWRGEPERIVGDEIPITLKIGGEKTQQERYHSYLLEYSLGVSTLTFQPSAENEAYFNQHFPGSDYQERMLDLTQAIVNQWAKIISSEFSAEAVVARPEQVMTKIPRQSPEAETSHLSSP